MPSDDADRVAAGDPEFLLRQVVDRQHGGLVAWIFEAPAGWPTRSEVAWDLQHMSFPVTSSAVTWSPRGPERFEFFAPEAFCWFEPHYGLYQQGQMLLGQTFLPPMSAADALVRWIIPKYRGRIQGLSVLSVTPLSGLAEHVGLDLKGLASESACVRIEYSEGGLAIEEELFGILVRNQVPYAGPMGVTMQTNWGFARLFACRAERGSFDARKPTFWKIARSVRLNPAWERVCAQIMQHLQAQFDQYIRMGYSQIQAAGEVSRAISANNDAMLTALDEQRHAAAHSRSSPSASSPSDGFDEYIRGVETVGDPCYGESQQDANYTFHWTDGSGRYRHTNDPFFNPNIGSTETWTLMEPKRR